MARYFDSTPPQDWLINETFSISYPFAMVCWYSKDIDAERCFMSVADHDDDNQQHRLLCQEAAKDYKLEASSYDGVASQNAEASAGGISGHACAIFVASNDRRVFYNGANKGTNAGATNITDIDAVTIGITADSTPFGYMSGTIAEAAIWDLSAWPGATDSDKADNFEKILPSLAKGATPDTYPLGLKSYWDLVRGLNDKIGGYTLTATGTAVVAHPRIIQPCGVL